jgi:GH18 family chitinase
MYVVRYKAVITFIYKPSALNLQCLAKALFHDPSLGYFFAGGWQRYRNHNAELYSNAGNPHDTKFNVIFLYIIQSSVKELNFLYC